jgi:hypothetical protein
MDRNKAYQMNYKEAKAQNNKTAKGPSPNQKRKALVKKVERTKAQTKN